MHGGTDTETPASSDDTGAWSEQCCFFWREANPTPPSMALRWTSGTSLSARCRFCSLSFAAMSAGRNLITLFFTVNTLLHFFFRPPSRRPASEGHRRGAHLPMRSTSLRTRAPVLAENHFFFAVFLLHQEFERQRQQPDRRNATKASRSSTACPPAENIFRDACASGVAQAEMRKLLARLDRSACLDARARRRATRARTWHRDACLPCTRSPPARCILTNDSRRKPVARCGSIASKDAASARSVPDNCRAIAQPIGDRRRTWHAGQVCRPTHATWPTPPGNRYFSIKKAARRAAWVSRQTEPDQWSSSSSSSA